ncbi:hypothetical protein CK203_115463 [Vitis vinifera]|uniref:Uncharacterized protein n=1 Tax=Vitis vinifera TaxID=29760 RepID=A0A438F3L1_VITVI|nr:hypothetical protein CK203_115463 [Vitis vinifera]
MDDPRDCRSGCSQHPPHDAHTRIAFQAAKSGGGHACLYLPISGWRREAARLVREGGGRVGHCLESCGGWDGAAGPSRGGEGGYPG